MQINIDNIQALVSRAYTLHAREAFGEKGSEAIIELLNSVRIIFQNCPPESLPGTLTVIKSVSSSTPDQSVIASMGSLNSFTNVSYLGKHVINQNKGEHIIIEIFSNNTYKSITLQTELDLSSIRQNAIIYRFKEDTDQIIAKDFHDLVPKVSEHMKSNFCQPTLSSLDAALERYGIEVAADSRCKILANIWVGGVDGPRLVLVNKPESIMRNSLVQALSLLTRDANVRPEQNTDETKPVDIRIEWYGSRAAALIEIKWLGASLTGTTDDSPSDTFTKYHKGRAQEGADQLADYLDREIGHSNANITTGYLGFVDLCCS